MSRSEVGLARSIDEITEGNEVMEKRGQLEGSPQQAAKGQTQRWQPLLPHLVRVNAVARRSGQTRFSALLHHVDVAALGRAFKRQRRAASPGVDGVTVDEYEQNLEENLQRLHARVHSGQYWPKPVLRAYIPKCVKRAKTDGRFDGGCTRKTADAVQPKRLKTYSDYG